MSWNGTVRCSYCYEDGHNRRGCPHLKKAMQERLDNPKSEWDHRTAVSYFERKKSSIERAVRNRRCSYCGISGHNRKTCKVLKKDMEAVTQATIKYRKRLYDDLYDLGIGVGALVSFTINVGEKLEQKIMGVISDINWEAVNSSYASREWTQWGYGYSGNDRARLPTSDIIGLVVSNSKWVNDISDYKGWSEPKLVEPGKKLNLCIKKLFGLLDSSLLRINERTHNAKGIEVFTKSAIQIVVPSTLSDSSVPENYFTDFDIKGSQLAMWYNFEKCESNKRDPSRLLADSLEWNNVYEEHNDWRRPTLEYI